MTQAASADAPSPASGPRRRRRAWVAPLLAGVCFGVGYGITQRLLAFNVGELIRFGQSFDVQTFPGTSLESLRLRYWADPADLRGDLAPQPPQRQGQPPAAGDAPIADPAPTAADAPLPGDGTAGLDTPQPDPAAGLPPEPAAPAEPALPAPQAPPPVAEPRP